MVEPLAFDAHSEPSGLAQRVQVQSQNLDERLDEIQKSIQQLRDASKDNTDETLGKLAHAAQAIANGQVYQQIDLEAKGELDELATSLNQTLLNLQQLDASVKQQSTKVPELAVQLDAITEDTKQATQNVMSRLDTLMASIDQATHALNGLENQLRDLETYRSELQQGIQDFLERASQGENPASLAQEVFEFLFAQQIKAPTGPLDFNLIKTVLKSIGDESFEILNTLQLQDITRQKTEKVVLLLKQFQSGLKRLLAIFNIHPAETEPEDDLTNGRIATQDNIFQATLQADHTKGSVDDIVAQFKQDRM